MSAPQNTTTGQRRTRCMAGFVATLCLLGQLSSFAHNALVRHATCAEHGELIHSGEEEGAAAYAGSRVDHQLPSAAAPTIARGAGGGETAEDHGHDHCLAAAHGRGHLGLEGAAPAVAIEPTSQASLVVNGGDYPPAFSALYRLAPKNSPPA